jgi:hypothetical protein
MPPTPLAIEYVVTQVMDPTQLETFICLYESEGVSHDLLCAALDLEQVGLQTYIERMALIAIRLVLADHQRSPAQILQELRFLPVLAPLPQIQVAFYCLR